jgi:hypothetical protein
MKDRPHAGDAERDGSRLQELETDLGSRTRTTHLINNRQSGRRRGRGGGNSPRQGGGGQGNGSRIDNRARGNATQLHEKYKNMAADAQRAGDRVNTEYYLQFADHYFRVLSEQRGRFEDQQQPRRGRDEFDYEGDDEFGEEGEPVRAGEQGDAPRVNGGDDRRPAEPRGEFRRDREDGQGGRREWRDRNDRGDRPERNDRGERNERPVREFRPERGVEGEPIAGPIAGQRRAEPPQPGESLEGRAAEVLEADRPLDPPARRRGRPRRDEVAETNGFEADRLPPALTAAANDEGGEPRPRRRRVRPAEETPPAAAE